MNSAPKLEGNWYEERYFHADTRKDVGDPLVRPKENDIDGLPRIKRKNVPIAPVFKHDEQDKPEERFLTETKRSFKPIQKKEETITVKRMTASPQYLQEILSVKPDMELHNYNLEPVSPEEQFLTVNRSTFKRYI